MMSVELCREKAADCIAMAENLADPRQKAAMLQTAEWWVRLAKYVDEQGSTSGVDAQTVRNPHPPGHNLCPVCGRQMQLARVIPRENYTLEQQVLQCTNCGLTMTKGA